MHPKLQAIVDSMDYYQNVFPEDSCIVVTDTEKLVGFRKAKTLSIDLPLGVPVSQFEGTVTVKALREKRAFREEKDDTTFGVPYISTAQPIMADGQVIGVLSALTSNQQIDEMRGMASDLSSSVEEMTATNMDLSVASTDVSKQVEGLVTHAQAMQNDVRQINEIVKLVKDIAQKSKILGLNASIEAARSGQHGLGFAVVADEIQKMAQGSNESADQITAQLNNIRNAIETFTMSTTQIAAFTEQFATSMQELNAAYDIINNQAAKLLQLSH